MNMHSEMDSTEKWRRELQQRAAITQGFVDLVEYLFPQSDDFRDRLERIVSSGITSLQTVNCLGASPGNGNHEAWQKLVAPLAELTQDEEERKFLLSQALIWILSEASRKYGKFSTYGFMTVPMRTI
jgi:hypothetical protein